MAGTENPTQAVQVASAPAPGEPVKTGAQTEAPRTDAAAKAEADAKAAEQKAADAQTKVVEEGKSDAEKAAEKAARQADDARAKAEQVKRDGKQPDAATTAEEAKAPVAHREPKRPIADHHAQRFGNLPANPQLAPHLDPEDGADVKIVMNTSDFPDPDHPMVGYVHEELVGDYLRAGWRRA